MTSPKKQTIWGGSKRRDISVKIAAHAAEYVKKGFTEAVCRTGSSVTEQFVDALSVAVSESRCGHSKCIDSSAWLTIETNIITWWVMNNSDALKSLIEQHEQEYKENANRTASELLGSLGKKPGGADDQ